VDSCGFRHFGLIWFSETSFFLLPIQDGALRRTRQGFASPRSNRAPLTEPAQSSAVFLVSKEKMFT